MHEILSLKTFCQSSVYSLKINIKNISLFQGHRFYTFCFLDYLCRREVSSELPFPLFPVVSLSDEIENEGEKKKTVHGLN